MMPECPHLLISCSQEKKTSIQPQNSDNVSATVSVAVLFTFIHICYAEVVFIQPGKKLDTM